MCSLVEGFLRPLIENPGKSLDSEKNPRIYREKSLNVRRSLYVLEFSFDCAGSGTQITNHLQLP